MRPGKTSWESRVGHRSSMSARRRILGPSQKLESSLESSVSLQAGSSCQLTTFVMRVSDALLRGIRARPTCCRNCEICFWPSATWGRIDLVNYGAWNKRPRPYSRILATYPTIQCLPDGRMCFSAFRASLKLDQSGKREGALPCFTSLEKRQSVWRQCSSDV